MLAAARVVLLSLVSAAGADASEIKVISVTATGLMAAIEQLAPEFERATGHKLGVEFDLAPDLRKRIDGGEAFDIVVLTPSLIDELTQQRHLMGGARTSFARTGIAVCVRPGTPKPDITSAAAFRRAMLGARSVTYNPDVASGRYVIELFRRLGIAEQMRTRIVSAADAPGPGKVVGVVARGEAQLGLVITTDIVSDRGCELVGPLPTELQSFVTFTAAVSQRAKDIAAARALLGFLATPAAGRAMTAAGMEFVQEP